MKKLFALISYYMLCPMLLFAQGKAYNMLMGYTTILDAYTTSPKGRLVFTDTSIAVNGETRPMAFDATQATISDENGNLIIASNGCWIADATGNVMQNGDSLNPNSMTYDFCNNPNTFAALPVLHGNIILPDPASISKYVLFHQTGTYAALVPSLAVYYSSIDLSLNGGLGAVTFKNQIIINDTLSWGLAACKHAKGRDWWIISLRDNCTVIPQ